MLYKDLNVPEQIEPDYDSIETITHLQARSRRDEEAEREFVQLYEDMDISTIH